MLVHLPVRNLALTRTIVRLLATTALLKLLCVVLVAPAVYVEGCPGPLRLHR